MVVVVRRLETWKLRMESWEAGDWEARLAASWRYLGPSWGCLGPSWGRLGPSWSHLGSSWVHFGPS